MKIAVRKRRKRVRPELTEEQYHQRALHRAWACGERYARKRWRRRVPPRFRPYESGPRDSRRVETAIAFYRGYDQQVRAMNRRRYLGPTTWAMRSDRCAA